jgi:hypothetical protein
MTPFIVNARANKSHIKDKNGNILYEALKDNKEYLPIAFAFKSVPKIGNKILKVYKMALGAKRRNEFILSSKSDEKVKIR